MKRAFVDTNVILRFLTGDPPELAARARSLFESVDRGEVALVIDEIVLAEAVWVLESFYSYPGEQVSRVLQQLLTHQGLLADNKAGLLAALALYGTKHIDFSDALVAVHMGQQGVKDLFSFDHHFDRLPGIARQEPG